MREDASALGDERIRKLETQNRQLYEENIRANDAVKCRDAEVSTLRQQFKEEVDLYKKLYEETQEVYAFAVRTENELRDELAQMRKALEKRPEVLLARRQEKGVVK